MSTAPLMIVVGGGRDRRERRNRRLAARRLETRHQHPQRLPASARRRRIGLRRRHRRRARRNDRPVARRPIVSLLIAGFILYSSYGVLSESATVLLEGTPSGDRHAGRDRRHQGRPRRAGRSRSARLDGGAGRGRLQLPHHRGRAERPRRASRCCAPWSRISSAASTSPTRPCRWKSKGAKTTTCTVSPSDGRRRNSPAKAGHVGRTKVLHYNTCSAGL